MGPEMKGARLAGKLLHRRKEDAHVGLELRGRGPAASVLIEFRPRGHAFGPLEWRIQGKPLHYAEEGKAAGNLHRAVAHHSKETIAQVADHLGCVHLPPAARS